MPKKIRNSMGLTVIIMSGLMMKMPYFSSMGREWPTPMKRVFAVSMVMGITYGCWNRDIIPPRKAMSVRVAKNVVN